MDPRPDASFDGRVRALFDRALEVAPEDRAAFLHESCGGDGALEAEVASLLEAVPGSSFMGTPLLERRDDGAAATGSIGPYTLGRVLGRGGMGVVYEALDEATGQRAALKTVAVPSAELLASIRREIHALARIRHPGVVRILDEGLALGIPWYAMELVDGVPLDRLSRAATGGAAGDATTPLAELEEPPAPAPVRAPVALPLPRALTIARRLCATLAYLHGEGIVHRDLKPGNIVVRSGDVPVLLDFGLATLLPAASREALHLHGAAGTTDYIAPEQSRALVVDARADLFAVGCILYELLTGRLPFEAPTVAESLRLRCEEDARPPSQIVPGIPGALDEIVLQLLTRDPRARLGHASRVAAVLAELGAEGWPADVPAGRAYLYRPELAGRAGILAAVGSRFPRHGRAGGLVLLGGESGVGKTRLLMEIAAVANDDGLLVLTGHAGDRPPEAPGAAAPSRGTLAEVLAYVTDRCRERPGDVASLLGPLGRTLVPHTPGLGSLPEVGALPEPPELPPAESLERVLGTLGGVLARLAAPRGLLLALDDLHAADGLTLALLEHLSRGDALGRARLLVVGSYRREEAPPALASLLERPSIPSLPVTRLGPVDVSAIVGDMLATRPPPEGLARSLASLSEGNPFFVAEYLQVAVGEELLALDERGRWSLRGAATSEDVEALPLPRSIHELVARRLASLAPPERRLMEAASVVGRTIDPEVLERVSGAGEAEVREGLRELRARHLLDEGAGGRLAFTHDRLREGAYASVDPTRRSELHRRAADAIERADPSASTAGARARHWELGGVPASACPLYLAAARHAVRSYAHSDAEPHYRSYLALSEPGPEAVVAHAELGIDVLPFLGRFAESLEENEAALELARRIGDPHSEAVALQGLGAASQRLGDAARARESLDRARDLFREQGDRAGELAAAASLARVLIQIGEMAPARELLEEAIAIARGGGHPGQEAQLTATLAVYHHQRGDYGMAMPLDEAAIAAFRSLGDRRRQGIAMANMAMCLAATGRFAESDALNGEALEVVRACGDRRMEASHLLNMASRVIDQGHRARAWELLDAALEIGRDLGDGHVRGLAHAHRATLLRDEGDDPAASRENLAAMALFESMARVRPLAYVLLNESDVALERGEIEEALAMKRRAHELFLHAGDARGVAGSLVQLAACARMVAGDLEQAETHLGAAEERVAAAGDGVIRCEALHERARLRLARGQAPREELAEMGALVASLRLSEGSHLARLHGAALETAAAAAAGEELWRGMRLREVPAALLQRRGSKRAAP